LGTTTEERRTRAEVTFVSTAELNVAVLPLAIELIFWTSSMLTVAPELTAVYIGGKIVAFVLEFTV